MAGLEDSVHTPATRSISDLTTAHSLCHKAGTVALYHGKCQSGHRSTNSIDINKLNIDSSPFTKFLSFVLNSHFPEFNPVPTLKRVFTVLILLVLTGCG